MLQVDGETLKNDDDIREGWAKYFKDLGTPKDDPHFDEDHKVHIEADVALFEMIAEELPQDMTPFTEHEIRLAIKKMNSGKAADSSGLTAEHIQNAGAMIVTVLTVLFNSIVTTGRIPSLFKEGVLTPILKKGRSKENPSNYRGITINSIIGKTLEIACLQRIKSNERGPPPDRDSQRTS
jgi:hypothetical protein